MPKHPLDHDHSGSTGRLAKYAKVERDEKPRQATKDLQQRERAKGDARLKAYTTIEKTGEKG